jgi:HK97 family phage portal protein
MKLIQGITNTFKAVGYTLTQGWRGNWPTFGGGGGWSAWIDASGNVQRRGTPMGLAAFFGCLRVISEDVAKLPIRVYRKDGDGDKEYLPEHIIHTLLERRPNGSMTPQSFREVMTQQAMATGNSYSVIERSGGEPIALWPVSSSQVVPLVDHDEAGRPFLVYQVTTNRGTEFFFEEEMFHLRGFGDGLVGFSILQMASETLDLTMSANKYASTFFNSGGRMAGLLSVDEALSPEGREKVRSELKRTHGGADNTNKILVLDKGMSFTPFGVPPETSQMIQTRRYQSWEICGFFRVPLHKIMDVSGISYNAMEQMETVYANDSLGPWLARWEQEIQRKLLMGADADSVSVRHDLQAILKGTHRDRADFMQKMFQCGGMTINEIRMLNDMDPIPGGDQAYTQVNVAPVGMSPPEMQEKNLARQEQLAAQQAPPNTQEPEEDDNADQSEE